MNKEKNYWQVLPGDPTRLGAEKSGKEAHFAIAVPDGAKAGLLLYRKGSQTVEHEIELPEEERTGNISAVKVSGFPRGEWEYNYRIDNKVIQDPYAKRITGREKFGKGIEWNQPHAVRCGFAKQPVMASRSLEIPFEETILYKTHVRGFTMQRGSRVRRKGTFAGVIEKIPYLKELGINALELMPVYEFDELPPKQPENIPATLFEQVMQVKQNLQKQQAEETVQQPKTQETSVSEPVKVNYWGYGPACYFAPKASYTAGSDPAAEFAQMVDALHSAGIECILEFYFPEETTPGYILEVLHYWKVTFRVDGFHLLGDGVWFDAVAKDPLFTRTKLLGTNFNPYTLCPEGKTPAYRNLAEYHLGFQETMLRFLKGDSGVLESFSRYIRRNLGVCGSVHFLANNDGFTLADTVSYNEKHNEANGENNRDGRVENFSWNCGVEGPTRKQTVRKLRMQQQKNAFLMLLLSQGTPLIYGGDEFGNSQGGNNNAYCQDNENGWLNWSAQKNNSELTDFVKEAIAFRKKHPILHLAKPLRQSDYLGLGIPDLSCHGKRAWFAPMGENERSIGLLYCGMYAVSERKDPDDLIYVAYNMHWEEQELALPILPEESSWYLTVDTGTKQGFYPPGEEILLQKKSVTVPPRTIYILVGKQEWEEDADLETL